MDIVKSYNNEVKKNLALFYLQMYLMDIPIEPENLNFLKNSGYITKAFLDEEHKGTNYSDNYRTFTDFTNSPISEYFKGDVTDDRILTIEDTLRSSVKNYKFDSTLRITKRMWTPEGLKYDYETEFFNWINTINSGWQYYKAGDKYSKFELYKQQAYNWLAQDLIWDTKASDEKKVEFLEIEKMRMLTNSLYTLNKYGYIKNLHIPKYIAWEAQEVMLYLFDLGLSFIEGKARQIGATTTLGAATALKTGLQQNFQTKMVAEKGTKSEELFRDKVKYVIDKFPSYLTPSISNDTDTVIRFLKKVSKGKTTGSNSVFEVEPPTVTCVNGGSPQIVLLDEIGEYDIFGDIMGQARPALFGLNPETGRQEMLRQVIAWGTGGNMDKGGGAMQQEYMRYKEAWLSKNFSAGLIPLFLNCFARQGVDELFYENEKKLAYSSEKIAGTRDPRIAFHQAMPVTEEDMFLISSETIIPIAVIDRKLREVKTLRKEGKKLNIRGHFEPVFDITQKMHENSDVPYKIIGAKFIPAGDTDIIENSPSACVTIFSKPKLNWNDRYYKGLDPIYTATGHSNLGSSVWDDVEKDFAAHIDFKHEDYRYCYLQSLLLNLYYSQFKNGCCVGIPELIESNVGGEYRNYLIDKGFKRIIVEKRRLPEVLQVGGDDWGIKKHVNAHFIINQLEQLLILHIETITMDRFYEQLKTYVRKVTKSSKSFTYEPQNKRFHRDDALDGALYAWICKQCFPRKKPIQTDEGAAYKTVYRYKLDANYNQTLVKKRVAI